MNSNVLVFLLIYEVYGFFYMKRDSGESLIVFHGENMDFVFIITRGVEEGYYSRNDIVISCV